MIDGNMAALNRHLAEREERDRYQELLDAEKERDQLAERVEELEAQVKVIESHRQFLWDLLDDIDTLDDACKYNDAAFRKRACATQGRRYEVSSSDGYSVQFSDAFAQIKGAE